MMKHAILSAATLLVVLAPEARSQEAQPLTVEEAIHMASTRNPNFLIQRNDQGAAAWAVREAWGAFLPTITAGAGAQYTAPGTQTFGIFTTDDIGAANTDYYFSDFFLRLGYSIGGASFFRTSAARANARAVGARVDAARFTLATDVTTQYLAALRAQDELRVAERQLERAQENYELASARVRVGTAVSTEGKQAEVEMGRAEVAAIRAANTLRAELLRLEEQIGDELPQPVVLSSVFEVFQPEWSTDSVAFPVEGHPQINALRAEEDAAQAEMREARSQYFPTLSMQAEWSGFTRRVGDPGFLIAQDRDRLAGQQENCEFFNSISSGLNQPLTGFPRDCSGFILTPEREQQLLENNRVFPFNFQRQPWELSLRVAIPVFQGFSRQRQVEDASNRRDDAYQLRRAEELRLRTALAAGAGDLQTAYDVVAIEARNLEVAGQQLTLARERYRLGAANFLELLEAQSSMAEAERDHLNARYTFHDALIALEAAAGVRLRPN